jgi:hypothetical protein
MTSEEDTGARELFADLIEAAGAALNSEEMALDADPVRHARNVVLFLADMLDKGSKPSFGLMLQAIEAAYVIGKYCVATSPVEKFIWSERASHARRERSQAPKEVVLRKAIMAEYEALSEKGAPVDLDHPYKAAETLLDGVNVRLKAAAEAGKCVFKPMKSKALGDRLKQLRKTKSFSVLEERN